MSDRLDHPPRITGPSRSGLFTRRWLRLARMVLAGMSVLVVALFIAGIPIRYGQLIQFVDERALLDLGISGHAYAVYTIALNLILILAHNLIAAIIFWRCPDDWMAFLVSLTLVANGAMLPLSLIYGEASISAPWRFLVNLVIYAGLMSSVNLLYLFPNGRFFPKSTRYLSMAWAVIALLAVFFPGSPLSVPAWPILLQVLALLIWSGTGIFAQIYHYEKISGPIQRQQTKWALFGLVAAVVGPAILLINPAMPGPGAATPNILYQRVGASFFTVSFMFQIASLSILRVATLVFPLSFAIAIMRYRLWDIDVLINRTLVYGSLTGVLLLIYAGSVVVLQQIFPAESQLTTVISTLAITWLFSPLRRRIQAGIDRQFYRQKYDAAQTLESFSATLQAEVDLEQLSNSLIAVVEGTMQPGSVVLWLKEVKR